MVAAEGFSAVAAAVILLGAPGAGKGTVAGRLTSRTGFVHLSTGDAIRREMDDPDSRLGRLCKPYMDRGSFVPDDIVQRIADAFLRQRPPGASVLFDGFPRNLSQAPLMDALLQRHHLTLAGVFWLKVPDDVLITRLSRRWLCASCGLSAQARAGEEGAPCPSCGAPMTRRADDQPALIARRMELYRAQTGPLLDHFRSRGQLREVDATGSPEEVVGQILAGMAA